MATAKWNGTVIAESNETVVVEGNHYFPAESVRQDLMVPSDYQTTCGWKGVEVEGDTGPDQTPDGAACEL